MKYCFAAIIPLLILFSVFSCKPDDEIITKAGDAKLEFSTDTVFFDTVFVQTGSVSKRLKVYNRNDKAVTINEIRLEKLAASDYELIIDGEPKDITSNIPLRGQDSLLILVKVYIEPHNSAKPLIVEDNILFLTNGNNQKVVLGAFGQNAVAFKDEVLNCNTIWEGPKAHIMYGDIVVPENCTLTIRQGTKVYAHSNSRLIIEGTLKVEGTKSKKVTFQNDRLDSAFANIPGQWLGIFFGQRSRNNKIQYAEIKNALYGLSIANDQGNQTQIENTIVKNMFFVGLLGKNSNIKVTNSLFTNCGQYAVLGVGGGNYDFNFCTIANYTPDFKRDSEAIAFSDSVVIEGVLMPIVDTYVTMKNCIVWNGNRNGKLNNEILFLTVDGFQNIILENNILQTTRYQNDPKFTGNGNLINQDPKFKQPGDNSVIARKIDYSLKDDSPAIGAGAGSSVNIDLRSEPRPQGNPNPDMGAYENQN